MIKKRGKIMQVNLNDVIEAIEFEGDLLSHYYNKKTGLIIYVEDEETTAYKAEDIETIDSFEEWEQELIRALHDLKENPQDYIQLPDKNETDEYKLMVKFCKTIDGFEIKNTIRELKDEIENKGYINAWYDYREKAEYNLAKEWCEKNNIKY